MHWLLCAAAVPILVAADTPALGRLTSKETNQGPRASLGNSTAELPSSLSLLLAARDLELDVVSPWRVSGRQVFVCPPNAPLECPDGIHCTTPDYAVCCPNGAHTCKTGGTCCNGGTHCAPSGGFCCGDTACLSGDVCCPSGCATQGGTCCGATHYCEKGETCCSTNEGRCAEAGFACCGAIHQCSSSTQKCCNPDAPEGGCAPKSATCCGPAHYCDAGALCCDDLDAGAVDQFFCAFPTNRSDGSVGCPETMALDLSSYPGLDEIFENMCRGIRQSAQYNSDRPNEMQLSYLGRGNPTKAENRRASGCTTPSKCAKVFSTPDVPWSCDEFPPASSFEGGADAAIICVPHVDNRAMGSRWWSHVSKLRRGDVVRVKIKGVNCANVAIDRRRHQVVTENGEVLAAREMLNAAPALRHRREAGLLKRDGAVVKNSTESEVLYVEGNLYGKASGGNVAMLIPLYVPDDFVGTFNLNYTISSGKLKSGLIIDDWGENYGPISVTSGGQTAGAAINIGPDGVGSLMILGWADDASVAMSYTSSLASSSSTPTTKPNGVPAQRAQFHSILSALVLVSIPLFMFV